MKFNFLIIYTLLALPIILPTSIVLASSNMEVARDSNYASLATDFSAGQTIYVRVTANSQGDTRRLLNLKDNSYNQITSYTLTKISDDPFKFTTSFSAPQAAGYYSLEAKIESDGAVTTSVKTIKVDGVSNVNSSVKVNINNNLNTNNSSRVQPQSSSTILQEQSSDDTEKNRETFSETDLVDQGEISLEESTILGEKAGAGTISQIRYILERIWQFFWRF